MEPGEILQAVHDEVRRVRDETAEICAEIVESLLEDKQGLPLDDDTIRACAAIIRNAVAMSRPSRHGGDA